MSSGLNSKSFLSSAVLMSATLSAVVIGWLALWIVTSNAIDIIGMDMNVVFGVQQILLGHPLYRPPDVTPYFIAQYTPLYYYLAALPAMVARVPASDVVTVAMICRAVSALIAAGVALICYAILTRRLGAERRVAAIATVFIICGTANWYFAVRPDGLATLLTLASFYVVMAPRPNRERIIVAVALAAGAVLSKQTGVFAGIALCALFAFRRERKALLYTFGGLVIAAFVVLALLTLAGPAIRENLVDGIRNDIGVRAALLQAYRPVFYWFAPLIALTAAAVPQLMRRDETSSANLVGIAIVISFSMSVISSLKRGSAENYFNEFIILCVFAFVYHYVARRPVMGISVIDRQLVAALCFYVASFLLIRVGHQVYTTYLYHRIDPATRLTSQLPPVNYVRSQLGRDRFVLGFAVGLSNALPERMILPVPELSVSAEAQRLIDYSGFRQEVASGRVQFVIAPNDSPLRTFLEIPLNDFKPVRRFRYYTVFEFDSAGGPRK